MTNLLFYLIGLPFFMINFSADSSLDNWFIVNDGVMGGLSKSQMQISDEGHAHFTGTVSLENNGGFASVRGLLAEAPEAGKQKVRLRVRGDGRTFQFRIRTDKGFDGMSYKIDFPTTGEWQEIELDLTDFQASFRGRILSNQPKLRSEDMQQIGFLIADKQAGAFSLEVDWVGLF